MARTTVDDCLKYCPNQFVLAYHVARRARELVKGEEPKVKSLDDRTVVTALREVSQGEVMPYQNLSGNPSPEERAALMAEETALAQEVAARAAQEEAAKARKAAFDEEDDILID